MEHVSFFPNTCLFFPTRVFFSQPVAGYALPSNQASVQMGVAVGLLRGAQRSFVDVSSRVIFCCFGGGPYGRGASARAAFRARCGVAPRYCGL